MRTAFPSILLIHPVFKFAHMIEKRFAKQNPFQSYRAPYSKQLSGKLLGQAYRSTEQLATPILAMAKVWIYWPSLNTRPSVRLHAHGTRRRRGGDFATSRWRLAHAHSTRSEAPRRRGAPFGPRPEARGPAQRLSAPRAD